MLRNVTILYRGIVLTTVPVELDSGTEGDFIAEAMKDALQQGTFHGRKPQEIAFSVSAPLDDKLEYLGRPPD